MGRLHKAGYGWPHLRMRSETEYSDRIGKRWSCFRISEDGSLIDAEDNDATLDEATPVYLWHPVHTDDDMKTAWRRHFEDYEIHPLIDQTALPTFLPTPGEMDGKELGVFNGAVIPCKFLRNTMMKWGFREQLIKSNTQIDGFTRQLLTRKFTLSVAVQELNLFSPYDPVPLAGFSVYNGEFDPSEQVQLNKLPKPLVAALLHYGKNLKYHELR